MFESFAAKYHMVGPIDSSSNWLGNSSPIMEFDTFPVGGLKFTSSVIMFPVGISGLFLISVYAGGTGVITIPGVAVGNATLVQGFNNGAHATVGSHGSASDMLLNFFIDITDPTQQATVTLSGGTYPSVSNNTGDIIVVQLGN